MHAPSPQPTRRPLLAALAWLCAASLPAVAQTKLVVWHAYRGAERTAFEQVVAGFNAAQSGKIAVETLAVPYDAYADKISAAVPRGKGPDVFIYAQDRLGGWVEAGKTIEPLDFFLDPAIEKRFLPSTLEAMRYQNTTYGLPISFKVVTLIYNKKLVKTPPKTSGELVKLAKTLTNEAAGKFGLAYWYSDFYYHSALMNAFGGGVFDSARKPTANRPENAKSFDLLLQWLDRDKILPAEPTVALITNLFNEGRAAMVFSGPWFLGEIAAGVDYGLAPLPAIDEAGGKAMRPWMTVEGAYVAQPSQHKDAAFTFISHLTDLEAATTLATLGRQTPANVGAYENPKVKADAILQAFRKQADTAVPMPNYAEMTMMWSPMTTAMNRIVKGAAAPPAALEDAQKDLVQRIANLRK